MAENVMALSSSLLSLLLRWKFLLDAGISFEDGYSERPGVAMEDADEVETTA